MCSLFSAQWGVALSDDFNGTTKDLEDNLSTFSTLAYIWTLMVPIYQQENLDAKRRIQRLYVGLENGGFLGYQQDTVNPCAGAALFLRSEHQTCPANLPVKTPPPDSSHWSSFRKTASLVSDISNFSLSLERLSRF